MMTTTEDDIRTFITNLHTPEDLELLKVLAEERRARLAEVADLRKRFEEQAATFGLTPEAVINGPVKKARRGRRPKNQGATVEE